MWLEAWFGMGARKHPRGIWGVRKLWRPGQTVWGQLLRYSVAGGIAAFVNIGVYAVSWRLLNPVWPCFDYQVANVIGFLAGNITNYELSTRYVFDYRRLRKRVHEFVVYFVIGAAGLLWSALILFFLVGMLHVQKDIAKVITVGAVFGWNFGMRKVLLFSRMFRGRNREHATATSSGFEAPRAEGNPASPSGAKSATSSLEPEGYPGSKGIAKTDDCPDDSRERPD